MGTTATTTAAVYRRATFPPLIISMFVIKNTRRTNDYVPRKAIIYAHRFCLMKYLFLAECRYKEGENICAAYSLSYYLYRKTSPRPSGALRVVADERKGLVRD